MVPLPSTDLHPCCFAPYPFFHFSCLSGDVSIILAQHIFFLAMLCHITLSCRFCVVQNATTTRSFSGNYGVCFTPRLMCTRIFSLLPKEFFAGGQRNICVQFLQHIFARRSWCSGPVHLEGSFFLSVHLEQRRHAFLNYSLHTFEWDLELICALRPPPSFFLVITIDCIAADTQ